MLGFPYDDLKGWRDIYPENIFEEQFEKLTRGWEKGLALLESVRGDLAPSDRAPYTELRVMAEAAYCHFRSTCLQIRFIRQRDRSDKAGMSAAVREELSIARQLYELVRHDSRVGFEASNHYYYSLNSLIEKMVNCEDILDRLSE